VVAGTFLSLVFVPPRSRMGLVRRFSAAVVVGLLFGGIVRHFLVKYMETAPTAEHTYAAFAVAAFSSWWAMGMFTRIVRKRGGDDMAANDAE
jgi:fluoride ion exporter CrcB/FEX